MLYDGPREEPPAKTFYDMPNHVTNTVQRVQKYIEALPGMRVPARISKVEGVACRTFWNILRNGVKYQLAYNFMEVQVSWVALYDWDRENVISLNPDGSIYLGPPRVGNRTAIKATTDEQDSTLLEIDKSLEEDEFKAICLLCEREAVSRPFLLYNLTQEQVEFVQSHPLIEITQRPDGTYIMI